jgi:serine/threonine protein kinase
MFIAESQSNNQPSHCILVAHHVVTGLKVAVKILNKGKIKHLEMAEKVRREINILKMCTHPHIIRLYVHHALLVSTCVTCTTMFFYEVHF